jgi:hypothetical protein
VQITSAQNCGFYGPAQAHLSVDKVHAVTAYDFFSCLEKMKEVSRNDVQSIPKWVSDWERDRAEPFAKALLSGFKITQAHNANGDERLGFALESERLLKEALHLSSVAQIPSLTVFLLALQLESAIVSKLDHNTVHQRFEAAIQVQKN